MLSRTELLELSERIQRMDFDHVFVLDAAGNLTEPSGVWAPDVWHDPDADIEIQGEGWGCMTGLTGQHGYSGAVMHASEVMGGSWGVVRAMIELCGIYGPVAFALVVVNVWPDDEDEDPEPAGWAIAYRPI